MSDQKAPDSLALSVGIIGGLAAGFLGMVLWGLAVGMLGGIIMGLLAAGTIIDAGRQER